MVRWSYFMGGIAILALVALGCSDKSSSSDCTGQENCACYDDMTCDTGLTCSADKQRGTVR